MSLLHMMRPWNNRWNQIPEKRPAGPPATIPEAGRANPLGTCIVVAKVHGPACTSSSRNIKRITSPSSQMWAPPTHTLAHLLQSYGEKETWPSGKLFSSSSVGAFCTSRRTAPTQVHTEFSPTVSPGRVKQPVQISGLSGVGLVCV